MTEEPSRKSQSISVIVTEKIKRLILPYLICKALAADLRMVHPNMFLFDNLCDMTFAIIRTDLRMVCRSLEVSKTSASCKAKLDWNRKVASYKAKLEWSTTVGYLQ